MTRYSTLTTAFMLALPMSVALAQDYCAVSPGTEPTSGSLFEHGQQDADLWDQGPFDGLNGLSNAAAHVFGARRSVLFDFVIPSGQSWDVDGLRWHHVWNTLVPPAGVGMEIRIYDDLGGQPGAPITALIGSNSYTEFATGNMPFARAEAQATATIAPISLSAGTYWVDVNVVGPENNFWETAAVANGTQCWVDYPNLGGLQSSTSMFGIPYDIVGTVTGTASGGSYVGSRTGNCPGVITFNWSGAAPGRTQGLVHGQRTGSTTIPSSFPCSGTVLAIGGNVRLMAMIPTGNGTGSMGLHVGASRCNGVYQLVEGGSCRVSNLF